MAIKKKIVTPILSSVILLVAFWDYQSGFMLSLFPLYLIPLVMIGWYERKWLTVAISVLAGVIIIIKDTLAIRPGVELFYYYWDEGIKVLLLVIISYGLSTIRDLLRQKERSNQELKQALSEIRELREMIPICAWCHSIRNDKGFYERIEVYLSQITGAKFTHGICPSCMEKYYAHLQEQGKPGGPEGKKGSGDDG